MQMPTLPSLTTDGAPVGRSTRVTPRTLLAEMGRLGFMGMTVPEIIKASVAGVCGDIKADPSVALGYIATERGTWIAIEAEATIEAGGATKRHHHRRYHLRHRDGGCGHACCADQVSCLFHHWFLKSRSSCAARSTENSGLKTHVSAKPLPVFCDNLFCHRRSFNKRTGPRNAPNFNAVYAAFQRFPGTSARHHDKGQKDLPTRI